VSDTFVCSVRYQLYLITSEDAPRQRSSSLVVDEFAAFLQSCAKTCDPVIHDHCFQREGSRHFTLLTIKDLTPSEADGVHFAKQTSKLPVTVDFASFSHYGKTVALKPISESVEALRDVTFNNSLQGISPSVALRINTELRKNVTDLHLSLYRVRNYNPESRAIAEFANIRLHLRDARFGRVVATRVMIEKVEVAYSEARSYFKAKPSGSK
jgi:hypothetical protein